MLCVHASGKGPFYSVMRVLITLGVSICMNEA